MPDPEEVSYISLHVFEHGTFRATASVSSLLRRSLIILHVH